MSINDKKKQEEEEAARLAAEKAKKPADAWEMGKVFINLDLKSQPYDPDKPSFLQGGSKDPTKNVPLSERPALGQS